MSQDDISTRKRDHLRAFQPGRRPPTGPEGSWLDCVRLVHQALPEMDLDALDLSATFFGHQLDSPLMICAMTGGTEEGAEINRALARCAERIGAAFGLGSLRPALEDPACIDTYAVRRAAPGVPLVGNLGGAQLARVDIDALRALLERLEADVMCVHLNTAQELVQPGGDRRFAGTLDGIARLVERLGFPVMVKECGCGLSRETAARLQNAGVGWVDVAGAGGTCFVATELQRSGDSTDRQSPLVGWGIPTAASVAEMGGLDLKVIASGGVRHGLDAARAIALGADLVGLAAPLLQAWYSGGEAGVERALAPLVEELAQVMLLCGCGDLAALRRAPRVITGPLADWIRSRGLTDAADRS
ncbi:MAG: type 2 isopentenyl-diphosphate Delta-isomerase [Deltaproteobacteria bacterium]|nr:type 2 isopentenyl-diphosphate Delta-isomerase [Deltaproteobacteria bacterium]